MSVSLTKQCVEIWAKEHFVGGVSTALDLPFTLVGIECVYRSPVNILYYLLLQHPWPTMFCFLFCQLTVTFTKYFIRIHTELSVHTPQTWSSQCLQCGVLTPCSSSSFFISPLLCLSKHMEEMYLPFLISLVSGSAFSCY